MTPETYMNRYHGDALAGDSCPLRAEALYPCGRCGCGCDDVSEPIVDTCPCGREPEPEVPDTEACCCKASMAAALELLSGTRLADLVDFDAFFFLTDTFSVGGTLSAPMAGAPDNLAALQASFRRFSPCNCDLLDVTGSAYYALPGSDTLALDTVDQLSLCAVKAVAFTLSDQPTCPDDCEAAAFRRAEYLLRRAIREAGGITGGGGTCRAHCDCDNCCCDSGILTELSSRNLSRLATITVGPMVLQNVTVLGSIGTVLVLSDETQERFYLVCANAVEVLG